MFRRWHDRIIQDNCGIIFGFISLAAAAHNGIGAPSAADISFVVAAACPGDHPDGKQAPDRGGILTG